MSAATAFQRFSSRPAQHLALALVTILLVPPAAVPVSAASIAPLSAPATPHAAHPHPRPPSSAAPTLPAVPTPETPGATSPLAIAVITLLSLSALALGWLLGSLRRRPLLTRLRTLETQLTQQTTRTRNLESDLLQRTRSLEQASRHRATAERRFAELEERVTRDRAARQSFRERFQAEQQLADLSDPANQSRALETATLSSTRLLNREEEIVFYAALHVLRLRNAAPSSPCLSLSIQVSMGEFLETPFTTDREHVDSRAYSSINCKRIDLLIYSRRDFQPVLAIEHQGSGHNQGNFEGLDAVKRAALKKAGIALLETTSLNPELLRIEIAAALPA